MLSALLLATSGVAHAIGGPWTIAPGAHSVHLGGKYSTFSNYLVGSSGSDNSLDAITTLGGGLFYSTGLGDGIDVELKVPFAQVSQGDMYNLGDGTTDLIGGFGVGKLGFWSKGTWWAKANVQYRYRLALQTVDGEKVPGDDIADDYEVGLQVHPKLGIAASAHGFYRLGGYDIGDWPAELDSDKWWAALAAGGLLVGGKALIYATDYTTIDLGVLKTVWAKNNPTDNLVVSIGASVYFVP